MMVELLLAFGVVVLSFAGLGIGLLFGRAPPRGSCATAGALDGGICPVCGEEGSVKDHRP